MSQSTEPTPKFTSLSVPHSIAKEDVKNYKPPRVELTNDDLDVATDVKCKKFPQVEKCWIDPPYNGQQFTVISFVPAPNAKPDEKGFYGMIKVRGAFGNEIEMKQRCEFLIKNVDSYHTLLQAKMGYPLPLTDNMETFCDEVDEIEVQKDAENIISKDIRNRRNKDVAEKKELNQRKNDIRNQANSEDPFDAYITSHVKRAQLIHTTSGLYHQIRENKLNLLKVLKEIAANDEKNPQYKDQYIAKYKEACVDIGLDPEDITLIDWMSTPVPFSMDDLADSLPPADAIKSKVVTPLKMTMADSLTIQQAERVLSGVESVPAVIEEENETSDDAPVVSEPVVDTPVVSEPAVEPLVSE